MRRERPHACIRYRFVLMACALAAWVIVVAASPDAGFPFALAEPADGNVLDVFTIALGWAAGLFGFADFYYPHVEAGPGRYRSKADVASGLLYWLSALFFTYYFLSMAALSVCRLLAG